VNFAFGLVKMEVWASEEALLGVLGIRDNWQNNFRDKG